MSNTLPCTLRAGKEKASVPPGTGCKTTVALQLTNKPGTLFRALGCFAMRDIKYGGGSQAWLVNVLAFAFGIWLVVVSCLRKVLRFVMEYIYIVLGRH